MKVFWTTLALAVALLVESTLSRVSPQGARTLDPFLLVLVYCAMTGGEVHGMLAGAAAGWIEDIHFGGTVLGISGLAKIVVGFAVGLASSRFLLAGAGTRLLVLFTATVLDALLFERIASIFDIRVVELTWSGLISRAGANALLGVALFELVERRIRRETRL